MELKLDHDDLCEAITGYVGRLGLNLENKDLEVTFIASRSGSGTHALIEINSVNNTKKEPTPITASKVEKEEEVEEKEPKKEPAKRKKVFG